MGKILFILFFLLLHGYFCAAQDDSGDKESDDIKAVRSAYITNQLKLTPDEAQRFWPIYNNYLQEVRQARKENRGDVVAQQERIVNIQKKYKADFKRVIGSDERVNRTFMAEPEFRKKLIDEWHIRHPNANNNNRQSLQQMRQQKLKRN